LQIATAPVGEVQRSDLPAPGSTASARAVAAAASAQPAAEASAAPALRLPETVTQTMPDPGSLFVRLGTFQSFEYADIQRARVAGLGAHIVRQREGRLQTFRVIVGPFTTVPQADRVLDQALAAGVTDARIVVE
jgi:rare lipoprotein A